MAVKIYLEKTYDRVCWDFIKASLKAAGIPNMFINFIMFIISNSIMEVL